MTKPVFEIDGLRFSNLREFYDEIEMVLIPGAKWGRNLDAFDDILRGGFGTPEGGFVLRWKNRALSRERLGVWRDSSQLVFDLLVEIIQEHGPGGRESDDGVDLVLA